MSRLEELFDKLSAAYEEEGEYFFDPIPTAQQFLAEVIERDVIGADEPIPHPILTNAEATACNILKKSQRYELAQVLGIENAQKGRNGGQ